MCKEHQVSISSPFEALAVPVIFIIKCEVFFFVFFFHVLKKRNDISMKTLFLQRMHLIIDPV